MWVRIPIERGLMDRGLVVEPDLTCRTCGGGPKECPGPFGQIELASLNFWWLVSNGGTDGMKNESDIYIWAITKKIDGGKMEDLSKPKFALTSWNVKANDIVQIEFTYSAERLLRGERGQPRNGNNE